jgi:HPt (histidine-containing phosphotransfer) domain-containing protein
MENTKENAATVRAILDTVQIEGVDIVNGLKRFEGNAEAYLQVIKTFVNSTPRLLEKIDSLYAKSTIAVYTLEDITTYAITVHGIRGCCYSICANNAGNKAHELEAAAKIGNIELIQAGHTPFVGLIRTLIADFSGLLAAIQAATATGEKPLKPAPDPDLLKQLLEACAHYDITVMEQILAELEKYAYEQDADLILWLDKQVNNLEYAAVEERLGAMLSNR